MFDMREIGYNAAAPASRPALIMGNSDIRDRRVAGHLAQLNYAELQHFRQVGSASGTGPNWDRLEKLMKTNPDVMGSMVGLYKDNPGRYEQTLKSVGNNFAANPDFAEAMVKKLEQNPAAAGAELQKFEAARMGGQLRTYIAQTTGAPIPAAPKPEATELVSGAAKAEATAAITQAQATSRTRQRVGAPTANAAETARQAQLDRIATMAAGRENETIRETKDRMIREALADQARRAGKSTPAEANAAAPAGTEKDKYGLQVINETAAEAEGLPRGGKITAAAAKKQLGVIMADPANKDFANLVKQHQLQDQMTKVLENNPEQVATLSDPGTMKKYMDQLKAGKTKDFMGDFEGESGAAKPMGLQDVLGDWRTQLERFGNEAKVTGKKSFLGEMAAIFSSGMKSTGDLMGKIFGANMGSGVPLATMYARNAEAFAKEPSRNPWSQDNLNSFAHQALDNARSSDPQLRRHGIRMLQQELGATPQQVQELLDPNGNKTIAFAQYTKTREPDPLTKKLVDKDNIAIHLTSVGDMTRALQLQTAPQPAGGGATTSPVKPQAEIVSRPLAAVTNELPAPAPRETTS